MRGILLASLICAVFIYTVLHAVHDTLHTSSVRPPAANSLSTYRVTWEGPPKQLCDRNLGECESAPSSAEIPQTAAGVDDANDEQAAPVDRFRVLVLRGTLRDREGKPLSGDVEMLFTIYNRETGGAPMWQESQIVQANERGRFKALVGSMTQNGVPREVLEAESSLWVDQQVLLAGAINPPRLPLARTEEGLSAKPIDEPFTLPEQPVISELQPQQSGELPIEAVGSQTADVMTQGDRSHRAHGRARSH